MARTNFLAVVLFSSVIQAAASVDFMFKSFKAMTCKTVNVPFVCGDIKDHPMRHLAIHSMLGGSSSSSCSGGGCCSSSSCYNLPMMGCASSRGPANCVGGGLTSAGQCMCASGGSCSQGVCKSGGSSVGVTPDLSDLFEEGDGETLLVPPEDHSRAMALYTGAACLLVVAGLSVGVRQARSWASSPSRRGAEEQDEQGPAWELLEQAGPSDGIVD